MAGAEYSTTKDTATIDLLPGECWWGGLSADGHLMPYTAATEIERDLMDNRGNQSQPLLVSSKGRFVWCDQPFAFHFSEGVLSVKSDYGKIEHGTCGQSARNAFEHVSARFFPSEGIIPDPLLFTAPQYNTWIELMYDQNEEGILEYGQAIIDRDYPAGVLMIDDNWQEDYGDWLFSAKRFSHPIEMMDRLHDQGFKVMLWTCPFVSPDSAIFRHLAEEGMLLLDPERTQNILWANTQNKAAIVRWWNGASSLLDLSNPKTQVWFMKQLDHLVQHYHVDGFKFDAGDANFYCDGLISFKPDSLPVDHTHHFAELGLKYPLNEYRASWKMAGKPLVQRLRDKGHNWEDLTQLIPGIISQGLMGYAFTSPDMIGGGEYRSFLNAGTIDQELMVRSAQVHALMPMMQFSVAPWRVLDPKWETICRKMAHLHVQFGEEILALAQVSAKTGDPIVKSMEWFWPNQGYEKIHDQFILGETLLVAPVVKKAARSKNLIIPPGKWQGDDDSIVEGPAGIEINVPLERLPYFRRLS